MTDPTLVNQGEAEILREAEQVFRHKKRGTLYTVIGEAELQMSNDYLVDGSELVIYRGEDGKLWARHIDEFHDGRFEALTAQGGKG